MIGAVTDDFTGAASAGMLMAKSQVKTGLFFDAEAVERFKDKDRLEAIFVSSNSRHLNPVDAYNEVYRTTEALAKTGVKHFSKKIDTTLRGGIGFEVDAMLDYLGDDVMAVVVTAMPQSKRICVGGFSIIDGIILTETPVAKDVKTPVKECYVPSLLQGQTKHKVDLITIKSVVKGTACVIRDMEASKRRGNRVLVVDAMTLEHVDIIAQACAAMGWNILAVDPGAFTTKLNYHRGLAGEEVTWNLEPDFKINRNGKTALFVVGSANPMTKTQIERLCSEDITSAVISVSPHALMDGEEVCNREIDRAANEVLERMNQAAEPEVIIIETALHGSVVDLEYEDKKRNYAVGTGSQMINDGLAQITERIIEMAGQERIAGLMLTGGDTMESVCRRIGVASIQAIGNIVAQVDVGKIIGKYDGLPVIVKGGFCGYEEIGIDIVKRLFWEAEN